MRIPPRPARRSSRPGALGQPAACLLLTLLACAAPERGDHGDPGERDARGFRAAVSVDAVAAEPISAELALETFDAAWSTIDETHFDPEFNGVDWSALREELRPRAARARTTEELRAVLDDMLERLGQSHFAVIPVDELPASAGEGASADGEGRSAEGAREGREGDGENDQARDGSPGFDVRLRDGLLLVSAVDRDGAAQDSGVRPGWILLRAGDFVARASAERSAAARPPGLAPRARERRSRGRTGPRSRASG